MAEGLRIITPTTSKVQLLGGNKVHGRTRQLRALVIDTSRSGPTKCYPTYASISLTTRAFSTPVSF